MQAPTPFTRPRRPRRQRTLTAQLVLTIVMIVGIAIVFLGFATTTLMRQYMIQSVDADLRNSGYSVADRLLKDIQSGEHINVDNRYSFSNYWIYLSFETANPSAEPVEIRPYTTSRYSVPADPGKIIADSVAGGDQAKINREPFTVAATNALSLIHI